VVSLDLDKPTENSSATLLLVTHEAGEFNLVVHVYGLPSILPLGKSQLVDAKGFHLFQAAAELLGHIGGQTPQLTPTEVAALLASLELERQRAETATRTSEERRGTVVGGRCPNPVPEDYLKYRGRARVAYLRELLAELVQGEWLDPVEEDNGQG
jgi:hypothetical protein